MTTYSFILKRLADDWKLLLAIFAGVVIASTLLAGAPIYISTLERQGIDTAIDRAEQTALNIYAVAPYIALTQAAIDDTDRSLTTSIDSHVAEIYRSKERYLKTPTHLVGTPNSPLVREHPARGDTAKASRGYFQYLSNIGDHVTFLSGRMATDEITWAGGNPRIEAVIGERAGHVFNVDLGDTFEFTPSLTNSIRAYVEIVGVLEPTDPSEDYWQHNSNLLINPAPLEEPPDIGVEVIPEEPPLAVFVTKKALIEAVGGAFPGTLVNSSWYVFIDKERLKAWSKTETRGRLSRLEADVARAMQGSAVFTGIDPLLAGFEHRSLFTSVPLLLLLVVTSITVLYYVLMMVSYLVTSREADVALLRSRGVGSWHLVRIYALEGLAITAIAVLMAPPIAMGAITLAGKLPYFQDITLGAFLPVSLQWRPFAVAAGTGLVCLAIYVVPGVVGARTGLIVHKLRSSRPPSAPFFQRYYIDVGLMIIGGLIFWELFSRGQIISGGLFERAGINEAMLSAPVLILTVVALLFMRFFPLIVRYLSGDSPALMHLLAFSVLAALGAIVVVSGFRAGEGLGWIWRPALLVVIAALYAGVWKWRRRAYVIGGLALQAGLMAVFVYADPPTADAVIYIPTIVLAALIPMQVLYMALSRLARTYPVWMSMAMWRMARNPLQYSWLVLLIVMVTGLAILATTVGGTLDRSYKERVLYDVASDLRVTGIPAYFVQGTDSMKRRYLALPGISSISLALRSQGRVGATYTGGGFNILAVESEEFPYVVWYREDFSERPLPQVMSLLRTGANLPPIQLPYDVDRLYVWTRPVEEYPNMFLWMVVQDGRGLTDTVTFGRIPGTEWSLLETTVPRSLQPPINLISVQVFEPAFGPTGTAGTILLDDIYATTRNGGEPQMLDDFEGVNKWTPLSTSMISNDTIGSTRQNVKNGERSGVFIFGKDTDRGIRGFYRSPSGGPVPVVASSDFTRWTGTAPGDSLIVNIYGRLIPVRIMDTVNYFPTMRPGKNGFLVADLQSLLRHLNILSPVGNVSPNEMLVTKAPGAGEDVYRMARSLAPAPDLVRDKSKMLEAIRVDPLITAGWRAMMSVAVAIAILAAALGYITYLLSFSAQSRMEMGFLLALGLRSRQMTRLLSAEHLVIVAIGLTIGTVAGFSMSSIMVSALAVTESGAEVVPPFILTTDWVVMAPVYGALVFIFVGALLWLSRSVTRLDLYEMSRLEGE